MNSHLGRVQAVCVALLLLVSGFSNAAESSLVRVVDLNLGESAEVTLVNGAKARVKLLDVQETHDAIRNAVRTARVKVEINGQITTLEADNYQLAVTFAGGQVDCPITRGYSGNSTANPWGLGKDARLRFWPAGSPWIEPGTFGYSVRQRWFASGTQFSNEPAFVDGGEVPSSKWIYYHNDLDFGGCEALVDVVAAKDGFAVTQHAFAKPGHYLARVERANDCGEPAIAHLWVLVEP